MEELKQKTIKKRSSFAVRLLSFFVTLVLVLGALALVVNYEKLNIDGVRRSFTYWNMETDDQGQAAEFTYEGNISNSFATFQSGLLICSATGLQMFSKNGVEIIRQTFRMEQPAVSVSASRAAVYGIGGSELRVFSGKEEVYSVRLEDGLAILSAKVNDSGWLALTAQEPSYKGAVTIYNDTGKKMFRFNSSSRFLLDGAVAEDCKSMAAVTAGQAGMEFESDLIFYQLHREEEHARLSLGNNLPLDMRYMGGNVCLLGDYAVMVVDGDGTLLGRYDYADRYLRNFSLAGDGFATLLLGKFQTGGQVEIVTVDQTGKALATRPVSEEILSLSSAGRYVAALYTDRLEIYTKDLTAYAKVSNLNKARRVIMRDDGTAMLIGATSAQLFIPG